MEYAKKTARALVPLLVASAFTADLYSDSAKDKLDRYLRQSRQQAYRQQRAAAPRYIVKIRPDGAVVIDRSGGRSTATYRQFSRQTPSNIIIPDRNDPATFYRIRQSPRDGAEARRYNLFEELEQAKRNVQAWWQRNIR